MAVEERGAVLGPRVYRGLLFGGLRPSQILALGVGGGLALLVMWWSPLPMVFVFPLSLLAALIPAVLCAAVAFIPVNGLLLAEWAPHTIAFAVARARGRTAWEAHALTVGCAVGEHDLLWEQERLPAALQGLRILDLAGVGVVYDAAAGTVCGCLRVHLHAIGQLDEDEQRRRYAAFGRLLDEQALENDPQFRLQLVKRVVPRHRNEELQYLDEMVVDRRGRHARALYDLAAGQEDRDHEMFVVVRRGVRSRTVADRDAALHRAATHVREQLEAVDEALRHARISLRTPDPILDAGRYARLIKDQVDPFGVETRNLLAYETRDDGIDPERAFPEHKDELAYCWRADSADHVAWWVSQWPTEPVDEGWLEPLMLPAKVPLLNVSVVLRPVPAVTAVREAQRALVSDRSSAHTRAEIGQITTTEHLDREAQGVRHEREARRHSTWRFEACVSTSGPVGDRVELDRRVQSVEAACARARLGVTRMFTMHERFFARTLPLARGLRGQPTRRAAGEVDGLSRTARVVRARELEPFARGMTATSRHVRALGMFDGASGLGGRGVRLGEQLGSLGGFAYCPFVLHDPEREGIRLKDPNMIVFGRINYRKSTLAKVYARRQWTLGRYIRVIDPGTDSYTGEYSKLARDCGGVVVRVAPGAGVRLNPLASPEDRHELLRAVARASLPRPLNAREPALLDAALDDVVMEHPAREPALPLVLRRLLSPTDGMAQRLLPTEYEPRDGESGADASARERAARKVLEVEARDVAMALQPLCEGALAGMFDGPTSINIDFSNRFVSIDLSAVRDSSAFGILLACAQAFMQASIDRQCEMHRRTRQPLPKTIMIFDEAWKVFGVPGIAPWLQEQVKIARKRGRQLIVIMHRKSDLDAAGDDGSQTAKIIKGLLEDTSTFVLFRLEGNELRETADMFGLSDAQRKIVGDLEPGEALWLVGGHPFVVAHRVHPDELPLTRTDEAMLEQRG